MKTETVLVAKNITKRYIGVQALDNVDFTIKRGEIKCLAGENGSGKSTLVKIIAGVEKADAGTMIINEKEWNESYNALHAIDEGIQVIYQDLSLFSQMTVAENITMNLFVRQKKKIIGKQEMYSIAKSALDKIGVSVDLDAVVEELPIATKQLIAICRALTQDAKILFMDEPTTALTKNEVDRLLNIVKGLKEKGFSIVFISHKLDEVFAIADSITVLRNGALVGTFDPKEINPKKLSYYMTGREVIYEKYNKPEVLDDGSDVIEINNLSKTGNFSDISFSVQKGDIVGVTGLLGSGRTELALALFGLNKPNAGEIWFEGREVFIDHPEDALELGIALVPEDRATQGLLLGKSVSENINAAILDRMKTRLRLINFKNQDNLAEECKKRFNIKAHRVKTLVKTLSGGNQQKVVISKWVSSNPKLLILDTPTVGIDIGSKAEMYCIIQELAKSGLGVIIISDEIEEIVTNCNRVIVMFAGKKVKEFSEEEMKAENIGKKISMMIETSYLDTQEQLSKQTGGEQY